MSVKSKKNKTNMNVLTDKLNSNTMHKCSTKYKCKSTTDGEHIEFFLILLRLVNSEHRFLWQCTGKSIADDK